MPYGLQRYRSMLRWRGRLMRWLGATQRFGGSTERGEGRRSRANAARGTDYDDGDWRSARAGRAAEGKVADYDNVSTVSGRAKKTPSTTKKQEQPTSAQEKQRLLFSIFDAMQGNESEFIADGRPRVENVNDRAEKRGIEEPDFSREEIDKAFEAWQKRKR